MKKKMKKEEDKEDEPPLNLAARFATP